MHINVPIDEKERSGNFLGTKFLHQDAWQRKSQPELESEKNQRNMIADHLVNSENELKVDGFKST